MIHLTLCHFVNKVARLGQHVGKIDSSLQLLADDPRLKLDQQPQQNMMLSQPTSPQVRHQDFRRQQQFLDDVYRDLQQLRMEWETERSDWRRRYDDYDAASERARRQLAAEVQNRLAADKMEIVARLADECRQFVLSTEAKRSAHISGELSHVNDHFADLERWIHRELGAAKRAMQVVATDIDGRFCAFAQNVVSGLSSLASVAIIGDEEFRGVVQGLHEAVGEVAFRLQSKLVTLESVLPLEVKARQQSDDKLRRRLDDAIKMLTTKLSKQTRSLALIDQVKCEVENVSRRIEGLVSASEAKMATNLSTYVDIERNQILVRLEAAVEEVKSELAKVKAVKSDIAKTEKEANSQESKADVDELRVCHEELLASVLRLEQQQQQSRERVDELERWSATHAGECREVYEYMTWSLETAAADAQVRLCMAALVDRVADADCGRRLLRLEDGPTDEGSTLYMKL